MNRRVVIRNLSLAVGGFGLVKAFDWSALNHERSYSIVTDDPDFAIAQLHRAGCSRDTGFAVTKSPIAACPQDLAVVEGGRLLHPGELTGWEADMMGTLRSCKSPGRHLVTAEPQSRQPNGTVEFTVDGELIDRVDLGRDYRRIEIPGHDGLTVFSVEDGQVAVQSSSCRRQLCKKCGSVSCGQVVCAPNRLVAKVSGRPMQYDAISG